jgi:hypothetical protein
MRKAVIQIALAAFFVAVGAAWARFSQGSGANRRQLLHGAVPVSGDLTLRISGRVVLLDFRGYTSDADGPSDVVELSLTAERQDAKNARLYRAVGKLATEFQ